MTLSGPGDSRVQQTVYYGPGQARERERDVHARNAASDLAVRFIPPGVPACIRWDDPDHRATDWRVRRPRPGEGQPWVCGLCHPPHPQADVERRAELEEFARSLEARP